MKRRGFLKGLLGLPFVAAGLWRDRANARRSLEVPQTPEPDWDPAWADYDWNAFLDGVDARRVSGFPSPPPGAGSPPGPIEVFESNWRHDPGQCPVCDVRRERTDRLVAEAERRGMEPRRALRDLSQAEWASLVAFGGAVGWSDAQVLAMAAREHRVGNWYERQQWIRRQCDRLGLEGG